MKAIKMLFMVLAAAALIAGCSKEQPPAQETAKPAAQESSPAAAPAAVEAAKAAAEQVKQKAEETAAEVKTESAKAAEAVKEQAAAVTEKAKAVAAEAVDKTKQEVAAAVIAVAPAAKGPKVVTYAASMGKVSFNHEQHAGRLACSKCHPSDPPQKVVIDKEVGHSLCKGCHQESGGKAPTACPGCHVK